MKSISSLVNFSLFKNNLKRFWVLSLFYFLFTFLLGPFIFLMNKSSGMITSVNDGNYEWFRQILHFNSTGWGVLFFTIAFAFVLAIALNSQMTERGQMVFVHSLPTTKLCNYITSFVSAITLIFTPLFVNCCLMALLKLIFGFSAYRYVHVLYFMYELTVSMIVIYTFTSFIGTICGTKLFAGVLSIFFGTLPMLIHLSWMGIGSQFVPGYIFDTTNLNTIINISPFVKVWCIADRPFTLLSSIIYLLVSVGFIVLGYLIYKNRKNEKATDPLAFEISKPILKYLITALVVFPMSMAFAEMTSYSRTATYIGAVFGIFVGYFVTEMFIQKNFNVWNKWKGFVFSILAFVAVVVILKTGALGFVNYIPDEDEIEEVLVSDRIYEYAYGDFEKYDFLGHKKVQVKYNDKLSSDEEYIKLARDYHKELIKNNYSRFLFQRAVNKHGYAETFILDGKPVNLKYETIYYKLKNGKIVGREYYHNVYDTTETESKVKSCLGYKKAEYKKVFDTLERNGDYILTELNISNRMFDYGQSINVDDEVIIREILSAIMEDYLDSTYDSINTERTVECGIQFISKSDFEKQSNMNIETVFADKETHAYDEIKKYAQEYYSLPGLTENSKHTLDKLDEYGWKDIVIPIEDNVEEFRIYKINSAEFQQEYKNGFLIGPTSWTKVEMITSMDIYALSKYNYITVDNPDDYFKLTSKLSEFSEEYNHDECSDETKEYMKNNDTYVGYLKYKYDRGAIIRLVDSESLQVYKDRFTK